VNAGYTLKSAGRSQECERGTHECVKYQDILYTQSQDILYTEGFRRNPLFRFSF